MASVTAAIKRASAAARAAMNRFDAHTMAQLRELYQTSLDAINRAINHAADGDRIPLTALDRLRHQLDQELRRLASERNQLLAGGLEQAAELGSKPFVAALTGDELTRINFKAIEFVKQFTANDGLQLSDRLWRVDQSAKQRIGNAIEFAIIRGDDAFRAAQRMAGEIDRDAIAAASPAKLGGNIRDLMVGRGSALYQAQRVARTELNRAHGTAYMAGAESTPGCVGTRFLLSPRHPEPDICDVHATANLFGLGKGVYPPGQNPWPAHPNTLSYVVAVFEDDVTEEDRAGVETQDQATARITPQRYNQDMPNEHSNKAEQLIGRLIGKANELKAAGMQDEALLRGLFQSPAHFDRHAAKRMKMEHADSEQEWATLTFNTLAIATEMTLAIPGSGDMLSGMVAMTARNWVVIVGNEGQIVTSYQTEPGKPGFADNHRKAGDSIYEHTFTPDTRDTLARLFGDA